MAEPSGQFICPFLIMCIVSMPAMMIRALQNDLNPYMGPVILLKVRWSCLTMLWGHLLWRMRLSTSVGHCATGARAALLLVLSQARQNGRAAHRAFQEARAMRFDLKNAPEFANFIKATASD